ncbi:MAG TPA: DUF3574 domain-containing protein [bacterium]|jgi:hypothetical protein|nr:DUF3574 domain-containing protein [bacterium]
MNRRIHAPCLSLALGLGLFSACASMPHPAWVRDTLYFGLSRPGGAVTPEQWQAFLDAEVTPRFPDGLTVWPAAGQWRGASGRTEREASRVLEIVHPAGPDADAKLQAIRGAYKQRFHQESVLKVREAVQADF